MKFKPIILSVIFLITSSIMAGCNNQDNSKNEFETANQEMTDMLAQSEKEWQRFKDDAVLNIEANQRRIDDLKEAVKKTSVDYKDKYENQLLTLKQKNIELRKKLIDYKY